jgi:tetratricopeptide (TPR) repeat protein
MLPGKRREKISFNLKAKQLNDSAARIAMDSENYIKAIALVNEAIKLDSNYYPAYTNKLSFLLALKRYNEALPTAKKIKHALGLKIRFLMSQLDCFVKYYRYHKVLQKYFAAADSHFNSILDTMNRANVDYEQIMMNKELT